VSGESSSPARLAAVFRAGPFRLALPASGLREVARLEPGTRSLRGIALEPLALLRGGPADGPPGEWAVAVEGGRAFSVDSVEGVLEAREALFFNLPAALGVEPPGLFRGALQVGNALALEITPEALVALGPARSQRVGGPPRYAMEPASKALIFTAAGRSMAFALPQVLSVISRPEVAPVPRILPGRVGVTVHAQTLYPVVDLGALFFGRPTPLEMGIVVEVEGTPWVVLAEAVRGVRAGFRAAGEGIPGWMEGERGERALFPLFPSDAGVLDRVR